MVIWLIGLAGAGKTAIGRALYSALKSTSKNLVFLDGDMIREVMGEDLGHTIEDRKRNADRICRLCKLLDSQGINVICAILSIFQESQDWNRENYSKYFEVFLDVDMNTLQARDQKGLYSKASRGEIDNVVGFDIEFIPPARPDMVIDNSVERNNFAGVASDIHKALPPLD
jgi:adenylylsulfate kinase